MKNKYFVYAVINILIFIAYIYSTYFYFLVIWAISILFPLMLFILLKLEARYIQFDLHGQKQGEVGKRLSFVSEITSQYRLLVSGRIEYDFDFEAEQASERMITLIQPLMIIFLAVVICLIIISVLLPIYTLYNNVGNM